MSKITVTRTGREFTIVLDEREAVALMTVCERVGGPVNGLRGVFSDYPLSLRSQLLDAAPDLKTVYDVDGHIRF